MTTYCELCGNEEVATSGSIGALCQPFIKGPLQMAYDAYQYVSEHWGRCCGGLSSDISFGRDLVARVETFSSATHLSLHPHEHGSSSYRSREGWEYTENSHVSAADITVECGIDFYADGARCHWVFDNDQIDMHNEPLDGGGLIETPTVPAVIGPVSYAQDGESFLAALAAILDSAAEQAYMSDHAECAVCGGHYYFPNGPCCEDDVTAHEGAHEAGSSTLVYREGCPECEEERITNDGDYGRPIDE